MPTPTQRIDFQQVTKLSCTLLSSPNKQSSVIIVDTPHKGKVSIDCEVMTGFFTRKLVEKSFSEVAREIQDLEKEAKDYLLDKWINQ